MKKSVDQMLEERRENDQMVLMFGKFGSLGAKTAQELAQGFKASLLDLHNLFV
jgi:hypothetical protein